MQVSLIGPINTVSYGYVTVNFLKELSNIGCQVSLFPMNPQSMTPEPKYQDMVKRAMLSAKSFNFEAPCIRIWHQFDMSQFAGKGERIGYPIFELDKFNQLESHHMSNVDRSFVCSEWAKRVMIENTKLTEDKVHVVPLGVDHDVFFPAETTRHDQNKTVFFNCGKWEVRKGHDVLIDAFRQAFEEDDNVELWMMNHNVFYTDEENQEWIRHYCDGKLGDKVKIIPRLESQDDIAKIMNGIDCGVFISRAEGWNLELLECMAVGKHVIATNNTGHTEFCNEHNSMLVETPDLEEAYDGKWFHGQGNWHSLGSKQVGEIAEYMRHVHKLKQSNDLGLNQHGLDTARKFTWKNATKTMCDVLHSISSEEANDDE